MPSCSQPKTPLGIYPYAARYSRRRDDLRPVRDPGLLSGSGERVRADLSLLWEESFGDVLSAFGGFRAVERPAGASEMEEYGGELGWSSVTLASCPPDEFVRAVVVEEV